MLALCWLSAHAVEKPSLKGYFKLLDYMKPDLRAQALSYEAEFTHYLQEILKAEPSSLAKDDAKIILYGTLFLTNTNQGHRFGQISKEELLRASGMGMEEREELILSALRLAQKLLPEDKRIVSWIGTHELYQEQISLGKVSEEKFNRMVELAKGSMFAYTALSIISAELKLSDKQSAQLLELAKLISDNKIPCEKVASGKCFDHKIAPQTNQIGKIITGDIYLKEASTHVTADGDPHDLRLKSGIPARVIYAMVAQKQVMNFKGLSWEQVYLKPRRKAVVRLLWREEPIADGTFESMEFRRAYTCVACHQGGSSSNQ